MEYRTLGSTGIEVSRVSFGAGPVAQLMTAESSNEQRATIEAALAEGINWFDTAPTYGEGRSEANLGRVLTELGALNRVRVATKVRLLPDQLGAIGSVVREYLIASLRGLRLERVALLQIHNSITREPGTQPMSLTPGHVLHGGGVLDAMRRLQADGLIEHLGLTGLGDTSALAEVVDSGAFASIQIPYNLLNPSAGRVVSADFPDTDYGNLITACAARGMGVFAIRVLAGGALAGKPPSPHTLKTPFFPLDLYERDRRRADKLAASLPEGLAREEAAVRFALSHAGVTSAIIGFANPDEVRQIARFAAAGPLDTDLAASFN